MRLPKPRLPLLPLLPLLVVCTLGTATAASAPAAPRPLRPDDIYRTLELSEAQLSPDGAWVAYVVASNDRKSDEPRSAIWMVSWDGDQPLALTRPSKSARAPRWSPDGRYLAYLASDEGSDTVQVHLLDRRGGESRVLTAVTDDIGDYGWSPDGKRVVLSMEPAEPKPAKPIVIEARHFKEDVLGYLSVGREHHLYVVDVDTAAIVPLADATGHDATLPTWSPDGKTIAFVRTRGEGPDDDGRSDIAVQEPATGGAPRTLARIYSPNVQRLAWTPDGRALGFLQGLEPKLNAYIQDRLALVPAAGGVPRALTDQLDRSVAEYAFDADANAVTLAVEDDGSVYPAQLDLRNGGLTRLVGQASVTTGLSMAAGHTAILWSDDRNPTELYALEDRRLRKLTHHNDALLAELSLGAVEDLRFKSRDGTEIHGFLVKPPGYEPGRKYPTVLWIHGGPNGQDQHSFDFDEYQFRRQEIAASDCVVIGVNYRGSSGRGAAFARAISADWGHKEVEDLIAAVDHVVAAGIADPARLGIGGWSYGGILTDYAIASDRRFKAAVSGAGSANQISMYGVDSYVMQYNAELGPPWRNTALWLKVSYPFFHADRIHTPTLFLGGDRDFNVPVAGGEQMYEALQTLGVPTQLVVYPGQYHGLTQPSFIVDRFERVAAWYARYL